MAHLWCDQKVYSSPVELPIVGLQSPFLLFNLNVFGGNLCPMGIVLPLCTFAGCFGPIFWPNWAGLVWFDLVWSCLEEFFGCMVKFILYTPVFSLLYSLPSFLSYFEIVSTDKSNWILVKQTLVGLHTRIKQDSRLFHDWSGISHADMSMTS